VKWFSKLYFQAKPKDSSAAVKEAVLMALAAVYEGCGGPGRNDSASGIPSIFGTLSFLCFILSCFSGHLENSQSLLFSWPFAGHIGFILSLIDAKNNDGITRWSGNQCNRPFMRKSNEGLECKHSLGICKLFGRGKLLSHHFTLSVEELLKLAFCSVLQSIATATKGSEQEQRERRLKSPILERFCFLALFSYSLFCLPVSFLVPLTYLVSLLCRDSSNLPR